MPTGGRREPRSSTVERDPGGFVVTGSELSDGALRALRRRPMALETSVQVVHL